MHQCGEGDSEAKRKAIEAKKQIIAANQKGAAYVCNGLPIPKSQEQLCADAAVKGFRDIENLQSTPEWSAFLASKYALNTNGLKCKNSENYLALAAERLEISKTFQACDHEGYVDGSNRLIADAKKIISACHIAESTTLVDPPAQVQNAGELQDTSGKPPVKSHKETDCYKHDKITLIHKGRCTEAELHPQPTCAADRYLGTDGKCWLKTLMLRPITAKVTPPAPKVIAKVTPPAPVVTIAPPPVNPAAVIPLGPHTNSCSDITDANHASTGSCPAQAFLQTARAARGAPPTPGVVMSRARYNYQMAAEALRAAGDFVQLVAVLTEAGLPIADSDREMALAGEIAGRDKSAPTTPKVDPPLDCHRPFGRGLIDPRCILVTNNPSTPDSKSDPADNYPEYVSDQCIRVGEPKFMFFTDRGTSTYLTIISASGLAGCSTDPSYRYLPNDSYSHDIGSPLDTDGPPDLFQIQASGVFP